MQVALPATQQLWDQLKGWAQAQGHNRSVEPLILWVGFSGGVDSCVLATVLLKLKALNPQSLPIEIRLIHVDHQLQVDSSRWAQWCVAWGAAFELSVETVSINLEQAAVKRKGLEGAAREARYQIFTDKVMLQPRGLLVLGHHADDQLETVLLRYLRGSSIHGLGGMKAFALTDRQVPIWRPLLAFSKEQIQAFAFKKGLTWLNDPSNADTQFDRNFLRSEIVPLLKSRWPKVLTTTARCSEQLRQSSELVNELVDQILANSLSNAAAPETGLQSIEVSLFAKRSVVFARALLYRWLTHHHGWFELTYAQVESIRKAFLETSSDHSQPRFDYGQQQLRRYRDQLFVIHTHQGRTIPDQPVDWVLDQTPKIDWGFGTVMSDDIDGLKSVLTQWFCFLNATQSSPLLAADPHSGSTFSGSIGFQALNLCPRFILPKRIKQRFQDAGIPPWFRSLWPVLIIADTVLCLPGVWYHPEFVRAAKQVADQEGQLGLAAEQLIRWLPKGEALPNKKKS